MRIGLSATQRGGEESAGHHMDISTASLPFLKRVPWIIALLGISTKVIVFDFDKFQNLPHVSRDPNPCFPDGSYIQHYVKLVALNIICPKYVSITDEVANGSDMLAYRS